MSDDGRGFAEDLAAPGDWPRYGLQAMRERAQEVGATVEWTSRPGAGATVTVAVPVIGASAAPALPAAAPRGA